MALSLPLLPAFAQDAIGVTSTGDVLRVDTVTGAVSVLASGQMSKNCLAFDNDNRLWSVARIGPFIPQFRLVLIDPFTGSVTQPFGALNVGDVRGLAADDATGDLFAVRQAVPSDELVRISTTTGAVTVIGPTGFTGIQGLDSTQTYGLRAWDQNAGLIQISASTGVGFDPFPAVIGPAGLEYLLHDPANGQLYAGNGTLRQVSSSTGSVTNPVPFSGNPDLRGLEFTTARAERFGTACNGPVTQISLFLVGGFVAGQALGLESANHAPNSVGIELVGFRRDSYQGVPLPLALDPIFGTQNCFLNVSPDLTLIGIADAAGHMTVQLPTPPSIRFLQFYAQHAALEPVPGGITFSKGLRIRSAL